MAESKKNSIIVLCSVVGCIVTLLTCGTLIGNMQGRQESQGYSIKEVQQNQKIIRDKLSNMESKQAYLEGVVSTKLDTLQLQMSKMTKQIDGIISDK